MVIFGLAGGELFGGKGGMSLPFAIPFEMGRAAAAEAGGESWVGLRSGAANAEVGKIAAWEKCEH